MNILLSCIGKRGYIADYFRAALPVGSRIIGTSNTPWTPGFSCCDESVLLPPIVSDEYPEAVLALCRHREITAVLSLYDPDVHRLAPYRHAFVSAGIVPIFPEERAVNMAFDKLATFHFLSDRGIPSPETTDSLEIAARWLESGRLCYPLMVKPRFGFGSANTYVVRDRAQMEVFFRYAPDMLIQQFVDAEALNVDGLGDLEAQPVGVVPWQKLLSRQGETEQSRTIGAPELVALAENLIREVGIIGPFDGDFFRDASGKISVLELNLRFGGGYPVSHLAGADFPARIAAMIEGLNVDQDFSYRRGVTMMKRLEPIPGPIIHA